MKINSYIVPFTIKKIESGENIFIKIRIISESGTSVWKEDKKLTLQEIEDILTEFELQIQKKTYSENIFFFQVSENNDIRDADEVMIKSDDLCWKTFYLVLRKSNILDEICKESYFNYLPCPSSLLFGDLYLENLFKCILKLSYDIILE